MPLDRAHLSIAMQVMVPMCVVFFAAIGLNFAVNPARLGQSPMLHYADEIMPLETWGVVFLFCALLMATAMVLGRRDTYRLGLLVCCISMLVWAVIAIVGAFVEPVSFSAWAWPAFIGVACYAVNRSLERPSRRGN